MAASGYIQARLKFCAGFGSRGVFNFGEVGPMERVAGEADRARDRARTSQIGAASIAIGLAAGVIAAGTPHLTSRAKRPRCHFLNGGASRTPHPVDSPVTSRGVP